MTAREIVAGLGGRWRGHSGDASCPAHKDQDPSLSVGESPDGKMLVYCHAGCSQDAVIDALRERGLWPERDLARTRHLGRPRPCKRSHRDADHDERVAAAREIWHRAQPIAGTLVETYLRNRGITIPPPPSIRYHGALKHGPTGLHLPAMVCVIQAPDRSVVGVHRTFLCMDGSAKALVTSPKMALGPIAGGAVRLAKVGQRLGLCEGIEDGLTILQATGLPVWACLGTSGLRSVVLPPPPLAAHVTILADAGEPGEQAARAAAQRLAAEGREVSIARPPAGVGDFNEALAMSRNAA